MLEKAIVSEVASAVDEVLYRVEGVEAARLFTALADAGVNVDTIVLSSGEIVFSTRREAAGAAGAALDRLGAPWTSDAELGQVSIAGAGMRSHPEVAATALGVLRRERIEPILVSTSPIKITAHVPLADVERARKALAAAFGLAEEETAA